jgi:Tol biopolymer transport system component
MSANRTVITIAVVVAVVLAALVAYLVVRDSSAPVTGDHIAYSCPEQHNRWYAVCAIRIDGTEAKRLTRKVATSDPAWAPDGRRIAFTRHEDVGEFTQSTQDDIFVMDADGGAMRQLTAERAGQSSFRPIWSPTGERIAFLRSNAVANNSPTRYGDLFVMNVDGSEESRLTVGKLATGPAWSPDGRAIALAVGTAGDGVPTVADTDIWVIDPAGGTPRRLTRTPRSFESAPAWSPDGSRVAFARWTVGTQFDGKGAIYIVSRDGSGERRVLSPQHFASGPYSLSWSPDGRSLALETSSMIGCTSISIVVVEIGTVRAVTSCGKPVESTVSPSWQPSAG